MSCSIVSPLAPAVVAGPDDDILSLPDYRCVAVVHRRFGTHTHLYRLIDGPGRERVALLRVWPGARLAEARALARDTQPRRQSEVAAAPLLAAAE